MNIFITYIILIYFYLFIENEANDAIGKHFIKWHFYINFP